MALESGAPVVPVYRDAEPDAVLSGGRLSSARHTKSTDISQSDHAACHAAADAMLETIYKLGGDGHADHIWRRQRASASGLTGRSPWRSRQAIRDGERAGHARADHPQPPRGRALRTRSASREIASPDEAQPGETVIIRAHGVHKADAGGSWPERGVDGHRRDVSVCRKRSTGSYRRRSAKDDRCLIIGTPDAPGGAGDRELSAPAHDVFLRSAEELQTWLDIERHERRESAAYVWSARRPERKNMWESCREIAKKDVYKLRNI